MLARAKAGNGSECQTRANFFGFPPQFSNGLVRIRGDSYMEMNEGFYGAVAPDSSGGPHSFSGGIGSLTKPEADVENLLGQLPNSSVDDALPPATKAGASSASHPVQSPELNNVRSRRVSWLRTVRHRSRISAGRSERRT